MKFLLRFFAGLVLVVGAGLLAIIFLIPADSYRSAIESYASRTLEREVRIDGELEARFWPPLRIAARDVRIANAQGFETDNMMQLASAVVDVDAWAYLRGEVRLEQLVIERLDLRLERNADGVANWEFGDQAHGDVGVGTDAEGQRRDLPRISLGDIRVVESHVLYRDAVSNTQHKVDNIDIQFLARERDLIGTLTLDYNDRPVQADLGVDDLASVLDGGRSDLALGLRSEPIKVDIRGVAAPGAIDGLTVDAQAADLRGLLEWLDVATELPAESPNTLGLTAELSASASQIDIGRFDLQAAAFNFGGDLRIGLIGRPAIAGSVDLGSLDLAPYLPMESDQSADTETGDAAHTAGGWPDNPLQLPLPLPVDLDLVLAFSGVDAGQYQLGPGRAVVYSDSLSTRIELTELALYEGEGTATLSLNDFDAGPSMQIVAQASNVEMAPLLKALAQSELLEGKGNLSLDAMSRGQSVRALIEALNGEGEIQLRDGAILGINVASRLRQIATLGLDREASVARRTDFAEFGGSFTIQDGILANDDLQLRSPVLRLEGEGTVDLPAQTLDYAIRPRLTASLEGQDAASEPVFGVGVPLIISGPWRKPNMQLAIDGVLTGDLRDPEAIAGAIAQITADPERLHVLRERFGIDDALPGGDEVRQLLDRVQDEGAAAAIGAIGEALGLSQSTPDEGTTAPEQEAGAAGEEVDPAQRLQRGLNQLLNR